MSSNHRLTPSSSYIWGLQLHYEGKGYFTRWFDSEKERDRHERSLKSYQVKPLWIERINPPEKLAVLNSNETLGE